MKLIILILWYWKYHKYLHWKQNPDVYKFNSYFPSFLHNTYQYIKCIVYIREAAPGVTFSQEHSLAWIMTRNIYSWPPLSWWENKNTSNWNELRARCGGKYLAVQLVCVSSRRVESQPSSGPCLGSHSGRIRGHIWHLLI